MRKKNYFAGPSVLPVEVLEEMRDNIVDYEGKGLSIIEASHRGGMFEEMYDSCLSSFRELLAIPEDYDVYFLGGGATLQFTMIPTNFLVKGKVADYSRTGTWANKACQDAQKLGDVNVFFDGKESNFTTLPDPKSVKPSENSAYLYLCANETIGGIEWKDFPDTGDVPLIADMSSDILSRPVDVKKFGMIYGGVQKNLGPAGATFVIMRKDMLERRNPNLTAYMDYALHAKEKGLYNTPPVFSIWGVKLVLEWIKRNGGVEGMDKNADLKSGLIYDVIDSSDFWRSPVDKRYRSRMNIVFRLPSEELEAKFVKEATAEGMLGLKGHRSVGGLRASLYNALPYEDVVALKDFMKEFERKNG
ncbi:MAG: 3-phosphoserine/phosphohydroxythreonine transaminase [Spirochaetales bacterium]|uniref:3-phosphoserine/phosphohydroxythreonine transaminase n=1 Tax=Bullifex sp. TaxID=2815808 RepID=UPI002A56CDF5|nr:3-phosphoserine/phosphohydroxythreonine transaminase [Bullifex sp.]MDD5973250.1 3-phosphoserine/phosphohydroxythreonine transaminase [Spirochaetales bacterium]MDD7270478.1 3-phosphoserine/phosphohydroxythreonine transaminase [Spirochaetales bacterium]MDY4066478.1 3-phosphoserine/phosphohydroxythreonine transaminase [Bullifex sp.]